MKSCLITFFTVTLLTNLMDSSWFKIWMPSKITNLTDCRLRILLRVLWILIGRHPLSNHPNHPSNTLSPYPQHSSIMDCWNSHKVYFGCCYHDEQTGSHWVETKYLTSSQIDNSRLKKCGKIYEVDKGHL